MTAVSRFPHERWWAYLFAAPPILGFLVFGLGPLIASFVLSFTRYDVLTPPEPVGFENYRRLFVEDFFIGKTLVNTAFYLLGLPLGMAVSLSIALLLDRVTRFRGFFRTVYFVPAVCSAVALGLLWKWIYRTDYGLLSMALAAIGIEDSPAWLSEPSLVKPSLVLIGIWTNLGYEVVVLLAALKTVPRQLLEAAELDGASGWQRFRHVTFPAITPTLFFISVTGTIAILQSFDQVWVMTRGGPAFASATYMLYIYVTGFQYFRMGYACAMAWLLGLVVLFVTWAQFRLARFWVVES
ncbi:MAG TPA: sugar ABC transporter permease [Labilithrix sp.]|jgi:multiple sugar transport system permease protein|nr:sugar ABC transporter permease [Labilithrix sp.]